MFQFVVIVVVVVVVVFISIEVKLNIPRMHTCLPPFKLKPDVPWKCCFKNK